MNYESLRLGSALKSSWGITGSAYQFLKRLILEYRRPVLLLLHIFQAALANYLAFLFRFEWTLPPVYLREFSAFIGLLLVIRVVFFLQAGLYKDLWRYSSTGNLMKIITSTTVGSAIFFMIVRYLAGDSHYPRSVYILDWLLLIMISGGGRLFFRVYREYLQTGYTGKRVLLFGAGDAGEMIVRDIKNNPKYAYDVIGFIDDDPYKKGLTIHGYQIFGSRDIIGEVVKKYEPDEILITVPSAGSQVKREIYDICKPYDIPIKTLPGLNNILDGKVSVSQIKPLSLEDLLEREPVRTNIDNVKAYFHGKSVLVTGAGGSIGSELCRQIIKYKPAKLVMFDRYENGLFQIDYELYSRKVDVFVKTIVGDMRDSNCLDHLFLTNKPHIVFHAAAHKHVPLMEFNVAEAVKNNIFGTKNLIDASVRYGVESFVMISTDKAVNPANIMGATKKVAEFLAMRMNSATSTKFTTVRFGNVLGSNGSVLDTFREQLKRGGPLTVTHPEIKRFFMLIPEAVQLILIAASLGKGGEIFILDMGEQIKIVDLAENLIRLQGFVPHEEIKIEFVGLRPGDKLYEELFDESEQIIPASHEKLRIAVPHNIPTRSDLESHLSVLKHLVAANAADEIVQELRKIVPNFKVPV